MKAGNKKSPAVREKVISYKNFFGDDHGKAVLFDLMNKFHVLNTHSGDAFKEGQRSVVLWIMQQTHCDLAQLDKILRGEL